MFGCVFLSKGGIYVKYTPLLVFPCFSYRWEELFLFCLVLSSVHDFSFTRRDLVGVHLGGPGRAEQVGKESELERKSVLESQPWFPPWG